VNEETSHQEDDQNDHSDDEVVADEQQRGRNIDPIPRVQPPRNAFEAVEDDDDNKVI
jgi:hypothetical protein